MDATKCEMNIRQYETDAAAYDFRQLDESAAVPIRELFAGVFSKEPWNDDWSDENQLRLYIQDLIGQSNSLTFGLYQGEALIGISMGHIKHWYSGTEYCIDELCISTKKQGQGVGTIFIEEIEKACKALGLAYILLMTETDVPAFAFYKKRGFYQLEHNAAFAKQLGNGRNGSPLDVAEKM